MAGSIETLHLRHASSPSTMAHKLLKTGFHCALLQAAATPISTWTLGLRQKGLPPCQQGAHQTSSPPTRCSGHSSGEMQVEGYNVAYIGNIAFEAGEDDLRELMSDCTITKVRLHTDRTSGRFKGYAHVHFTDEDSLDRQANHPASRRSASAVRVCRLKESCTTSCCIS